MKQQFDCGCSRAPGKHTALSCGVPIPQWRTNEDPKDLRIAELERALADALELAAATAESFAHNLEGTRGTANNYERLTLAGKDRVAREIAAAIRALKESM